MSAQATVIVYDDFLLLRVPFAGSEYIGSCILQHGQEVGQMNDWVNWSSVVQNSLGVAIPICSCH